MVIAITGPTGVGKTELALFLAQHLNGEIINADSTQVYKGLEIATNKVKDKRGIKHHIFDEISISKNYTVFDYQKDARDCISKIIKNNKIPILVGGTGLYLKAALYDYKFDDKTKNNYEEYNDEQLYEKLLQIDPNTDIHRNNKKRIINALNYYEANKKPYSEKEKTTKLLYNTIFIGLKTDRKLLYEKINNRVDVMIKEGLVNEASKLYNDNIRTKAIMTPIGYKELFEYFDGNTTLDNAIDKIKQNSRRYAKRQYTWFNNQMDIKWFETDFNNFEKTENEVLEYIKKLTDNS